MPDVSYGPNLTSDSYAHTNRTLWEMTGLVIVREGSVRLTDRPT
jgi:hypothetical protein